MIIRLVLSIALLALAGCGGGGGGGGGGDMVTDSPFAVSGLVKDADGVGLEGVVIEFSDSGTTVTTDSTGAWERSGLTGTVVITPTHPAYAFSPRTVTVSKAQADIIFERSYVHRVGLGQDYGSIQAAIDIASAGETVEVYPGIYEESLRINKPITLRSTDPDDDEVVAETILKAAGEESDGIVINTSSGEPTVEGLTIAGHNAAVGVRAINSKAIIERSIISGFNYGVHVRGGVVKIGNNRILQSSIGILLQDVTTVEADITGNEIQDNTQNAVMVSHGAKRVRLIDNKLTGNKSAVSLKVLEDSEITIRSNIFKENAGSPIWLYGGNAATSEWIRKVNLEITGNTLTQNTTSFHGAAIHIDIKGDRASPNRKIKIDSNTIKSNIIASSAAFGGGIYIGMQNSYIYLTNNEITENKVGSKSAECAGAGVFVNRSGSGNASFIVDSSFTQYDPLDPNWGGNTISANMNGNDTEDNVCSRSLD